MSLSRYVLPKARSIAAEDTPCSGTIYGSPAKLENGVSAEHAETPQTGETRPKRERVQPNSAYWHYCIVRQDMPLGVLAAMLTHAAGESLADQRLHLWEKYPWRDCDCKRPCPENGGYVPVEDCPKCRGTWQVQPIIYAVVLGVDDECALLKTQAHLDLADVPHVLIREPDPPYGGAATALGLLPIKDRRKVKRILGKLKPLKEIKRRWTSPYNEK